jgi:5'-nucleotidase
MMAKRIPALLALLLILFIMGAWQASAPNARAVSVQLLAINDFHGNMEPPAGSDGLVNRIPAGGAEYLATHLRNAVRDNPNSLLVAAGDLMGASPLISAFFHDEPSIEAMNAMNLAVSSIGNHELDNGSAGLLQRIQGGCPQSETCPDGEKSQGARFQYLAANVVRTSLPETTLLPPAAVRTVAGVKIGFIGETLEGTDRMIAPASAQGLRFLEESSVANAAAAQLERQGVHAIVLLIHQGGYQHPANGPADPNGCENFDGSIKTVVNKLSPSIKVVISSHTHVFYNCVIGSHTLTSAGSFGRLFTRVNLSIDPATDTILNVSAKNEVVTRDVPKDPAQTAILDKYRPAAARIANRPVGSITAEISRTANEIGESALGDVIADAQLAATRAPERGGAEIAFMNSGGVRASVTGTVNSDGERRVSYGDLYAAQPFHNQLTVLTMTGDMLRRLLEQQFRTEGNPYILQVTEDFTYSYRRQAPAGQHVVPGSIALHGRPVGPADVLRIEASDFLTTGGDGFTTFSEGTNLTGGQSDVDALVDYVRSHSPLAPGPRNRITRVD